MNPAALLLVWSLASIALTTPISEGSSSETNLHATKVVLFQHWRNGTIVAGTQALEIGLGLGNQPFEVPAGVEELRVELSWTDAAGLSDLHLFVHAPGVPARSSLAAAAGPQREGTWSDVDGALGAPDSPAMIAIHLAEISERRCAAGCVWVAQVWPDGVVALTNYSLYMAGYGFAPSATHEQPVAISARGDAFAQKGLGTAVALTLGGVGLVSMARRWALWILSQRIRASNALEHPVRRRLVDVIARRPGMFEKEFRGHVDVAWGTLVFHLSVLERAGVIETRKAGRYRCYFAAGRFSLDEMAAIGVLRSASCFRLVASLEDGPRTRGDIRSLLSVSEATTSWRLKRLHEQGLIRTEPSKPHTVSITPLAIRALVVTRTVHGHASQRAGTSRS